jgi:cobalt/nickel transport system permease protein
VAVAGTLQKLRWLWVGIIVLIIASPLGLLAPGTAWGEWGINQLSRLGFKFVPTGMEKLSHLWGAPLAGYNLHALGNANLGYLLSAGLGILIIVIVVWLFTMLLTSRLGSWKN